MEVRAVFFPFGSLSFPEIIVVAMKSRERSSKSCEYTLVSRASSCPASNHREGPGAVTVGVVHAVGKRSPTTGHSESFVVRN